MPVRLSTVQSLGRNLKSWCRRTVPLICFARYLSDRPIDWFLLWIGWKFLLSSATYLFSKNDDCEIVDHDVHVSYSKNEVNSHIHIHLGRQHDGHESKPTAARRNMLLRTTMTASTAKIIPIALTTLPSVVLSHVACHLHPRDVLVFDSVLQSGMTLQNSADGSKSNGKTKVKKCSRDYHYRNQYADVVGHDIWKRLWYRDYGDVLLQWKVARTAFRRSLRGLSPQSSGLSDDKGNSSNADGWVEEHLSNCLDDMMKMKTPMSTTMKDFYFLFGECYVDYLLARKNTVDECFLGLHGHIFNFTDFAEYHPGLIEPIVKECGGDATFFFEDLPHSSGARNIARRLCVLVNHNVIDYKNDDDASSEHIVKLKRPSSNDDVYTPTKSNLACSIG